MSDRDSQESGDDANSIASVALPSISEVIKSVLKKHPKAYDEARKEGLKNFRQDSETV